MLAQAELMARRRLQDLRMALTNPADAREVFEELFLPEGLELTEAKSADVEAAGMGGHGDRPPRYFHLEE
jgi:hypothetical protein